MARFRLDLEYVGTRYSGWQVQKNARTVQGALHEAVRRVSERTDFESYGSGRTDAGVHALHQVAHLDLETRLAPEALRRAVNDELPADVHLLDVTKATRQFHARHSAVGRSYLYQVSRRRTAFGKPFVWWIRDPLEVGDRRTGRAFEGTHDFRSYADVDPPRSPPGSRSTGWRWPRPGRSCSCASSGRTSSGRWCGGWWG
jgi:tRNA pseudouridine38-40 synthase